MTKTPWHLIRSEYRDDAASPTGRRLHVVSTGGDKFSVFSANAHVAEFDRAEDAEFVIRLVNSQ